MSRIGRNPITVPAAVTVSVSDSVVTVTGPQATLSRPLPEGITLSQEGDVLSVERASDETRHRALHGLTRTLVANMVTGVTAGYRKPLEITGVGYRAQKVGEKLQLTLGYSHPIEIEPPAGISFEVDNPVRLAVVGIDKELVGQVAASIRKLRKPEPYKGKGVRYLGERVARKAGKAAK